jgi:hypothetical protein
LFVVDSGGDGGGGGGGVIAVLDSGGGGGGEEGRPDDALGDGDGTRGRREVVIPAKLPLRLDAGEGYPYPVGLPRLA